MARKGLAGQLNMFDFFKSMEDIPMGEVQMVSLMPEDELEVVAEPEVIEETDVVEEPTLVEETPQAVEVLHVAEVVESQNEIEIQEQEIEKTAVKKETTPRKKTKKAVEQPVETIPKKVEPVSIPELEKAERDEESSRPTVKVQRITSSGNDKPAMCRQYVIDGRQLEIAYINYNKVRITREGQEPEVHVFESSKDAVDYYVQKMQELEPEEE